MLVVPEFIVKLYPEELGTSQLIEDRVSVVTNALNVDKALLMEEYVKLAVDVPIAVAYEAEVA